MIEFILNVNKCLYVLFSSLLILYLPILEKVNTPNVVPDTTKLSQSGKCFFFI